MKSLFQFFFCTALAILAFSCGQPKTETTSPEAVQMAPMVVEGTFGEAFSPTEVVTAPTFPNQFNDEQIADTVKVTLRGEVNEVCQAKGCWMTIATGSESEMMVKFKDYGFFMPKDISGREVIMNGIAYYQVTSVDELRHYAEDAGKSADEIAMITEPKQELRFLADGVKLLK